MAQTLLEQDDVAKRLKVTIRTLERWRMVGEGPPYVKLGNGVRGGVRYPEGGLDAWIDSRMRNSTSEQGPVDQPLIGHNGGPALEKEEERKASRPSLEELGL